MKLPMTRPPLAFCCFAFAAALCWLPASLPAAAPQVSTNQAEFFESKVRPVLAGTCLKCHGVSTHKGGLRLDSRDAALKGGDSGPAVVPGNPDASPMIDAINYRGLEMPPTGKLKPREIQALVEWVKMAPLAQGRRQNGRPVAGRLHHHRRGPPLLGLSTDRPLAAPGRAQKLGGQSNRRLRAGKPRRKRAWRLTRRPILACSSAGCFLMSLGCRPLPKRSTPSSRILRTGPTRG